MDYESIPSLTESLKGIDAVASCLASIARGLDSNLVEAASAAGVKRFIPAHYTADIQNAKSKLLPIMLPAAAIEEKLFTIAKEEGGMSYTLLFSGGFLELDLGNFFFVDVPKREATLWDGGDAIVNFTTIGTIGKAIAQILVHSEETKNRTLYISEIATSQKKVIELAKKLHPTKTWNLSYANTEVMEKQAEEAAKRGETDLMSIIGSLVRMYFGGPSYGMPFPKLDNELLGVKEFGEKELENVVRDAVKQA